MNLKPLTLPLLKTIKTIHLLVKEVAATLRVRGIKFNFYHLDDKQVLKA